MHLRVVVIVLGLLRGSAGFPARLAWAGLRLCLCLFGAGGSVLTDRLPLAVAAV